MKKILLLLFSTVNACLLFSISLPFASAASFNPNDIISDSIFDNANAMTAIQIDDFLNTFPNSCISSNSGFRSIDPTGYNPTSGYQYGGFVSAGQVIYDAAQAYGLNPRVIIATLEKEQSLVTGQNSFAGYCNNGDQHKYAAAVGYGCPDSGTTYNYTGLSLYQRNGITVTSTGTTCVNSASKAGFSQQVIRAAWLFKFGEQRAKGNINWAAVHGNWDNSDDPQTCYGGPMTQGTFARCPSGGATYYDGYSTIDGNAVLVGSGGTAALYWYTPHFHGNQNFFNLFTAWFGSTTVPSSTAYIPDGNYTLINPTSGRVLDVASGSTSDGATTQLYSSNGTMAQRWQITRDSDGYYRLLNVGSNRSLDAVGAGTMPGTRLQIWSNNEGCAQKWAALISSDGLTFLNTCSGLALDVAGGSTTNGAPTQLYDRNGSPAQTWTLQSTDAPIVANGFYQLSTASNLDLTAANDSNGSNVQINTTTSSGLQYWQVTRSSDGLYTLRNPRSGKYLDVNSEGRINGVNVQLWEGHPTCAQKWQISKNTNGTYTLLSACSGLVLDVANGATSTDGTNVQIWSGNGTPAQQWSLIPLSQIPDATYGLSSIKGLALETTGGNTKDGTSVQLWGKNSTPAQQWAVTYAGNGFYTIKNINSGKYLDLTGASNQSGVPIQIYTGNSSCAQLWRIIDNSNSTYRLSPACTSNNVLDIVGGGVGITGTKTQSFTQNGSPAQMVVFDTPQ